MCDIYIYRESRLTAIDTLYQRARWFGYKKSYIDICRVYMTQTLQKAFIDTVDSENDMWNAIRAFSLTCINLKKFPRIFKLNNDRLILTRKSVAHTIVLHRVNPGYSYNKSVWLTDSERKNNRDIYEAFFKKWKDFGCQKQFGTSEHQTHYIIEMTYSDFLNDFLLKYKYPKETAFGILGFMNIMKSINDGISENSVKIVIMRYRTKQYRSLNPGGNTIKELPQSWNDGTEYEGDKFLKGLQELFHFQIHLVYVDETKKDEYIPMIAMNNPITEFNARYVTGDNEYETV